MSQLDTCLVFDGNCAEAMRFYERVLGGTMEMLMTHAEAPSPQQPPAPGMAQRVMHARLRIDGRTLMAADAMVGEPYAGMHGFSISLVYGSLMRARRVWDALAEGGEVRLPMQRTDWVEAFGMLVDRFGTPWMISGGAAAP